MFFIVFHLLSIFSIINCDQANVVPVVKANNWKNIEYVWPYQDSFDQEIGKQSEFYFVNDIKSLDLKGKIDDIFLKQHLENLKDDQTVKLSFKYWSSSDGREIEPILSISVGENINYELKEKNTEYNNNWIPFETILANKQLLDFEFLLRMIDKTGMAAIKDLQVEYVKLEDGDGFKEIKQKPNPTESLKPTNFPNDCYANFDNFNGFCALGFDYNLEVYNSTERIFSRQTDYKECFEIEFFSKIKSEVIVLVNAFGDKTMNEIKRYNPLIALDETNIQKETLCLNDYSYLLSGKFELTFKVKFNKPIEDKKFAIKLVKGSSITRREPQYFLSEMKKDLDSTKNWHEQWIISSEPNDSNFQLKESNISFSARAFSKQISSKSLQTIWLNLTEYEPEYFEKDAQIILSVADPKDFNSFMLRPKICTDYFHCIDAFYTKIYQVRGNPNIKVMDFNFNPYIGSKYFKLIFDVQYYIPLYYNDKNYYDVKFNLQLKSFGDPCSKIDCGINGSCIVHPRESTPICECKNGYTGDNCKQIDYCLQSINNKDPGQTICNNIPGSPDCINMKEGFRCDCPGNDNINWNGTNCVPIKVGNNNRWNVLDADTFFLYPTGSNNNFVVDFFGTRKDKNLCLKIFYVSKNNSILEVSFIQENKNQPDAAFEYFLPVNSDETTDKFVEVCIDHFRYYLVENFQLSIKVSGLKNFDEKNFKIMSIETNLRNKTTAVNFIEKWEKDENTFKEKWTLLPDIIGTKDITHDIKDLSVSKEEIFKIKYISNWITSDSYFSNNTIESYVKFNFENTKDISVDTRILYHPDEKQVQLTPSKSSEVKNKEETYKITNIPDKIKVFKIIIDILIKPSNNENYKIKIDSLSVGDPCFKDGKIFNKDCKDCKSSGPREMRCPTCDGKFGDLCQFTEDLCEKKGEKICGNFIYETGMKKQCQQIDDKNFKCNCFNTHFSWNSTNLTCLRKHKYLTIPIQCTGENCPFLKTFTQNFTWANKELPKLDKNTDKTNFFPFYYSNKNDNQLSFQYPAKDINDVCMNLEYSSTGNSSISVSYDKEHTPLQLPKTIREKEVFSNQRICVSDLSEPLVQNMTINLKFETNKISSSNIAIIRHDKSSDQIFNTPERKTLLSLVSYLLQYDSSLSEPQYETKNQWPLRIPNNKNSIEWGGDYPITFTPRYPGSRESYLFSHWLKGNSENIMFRTNITDWDPLNDFEIGFLLYDNKLNFKELDRKIVFDQAKRLEILKNGNEYPIQIPIPPQKTSFRFAIKVNYSELLSDQKLFQFTGIDIGDPCVIEGNKINSCNDRGTCKRIPHDGLAYTCECKQDPDTKQNYTGNNCQIKDFCNSPDSKHENKLGKEVCPGPNSSCTNVKNGYICKCPEKSEYWDTTEHKCLSIPQCLTHKCNQFEKCVENQPNNPNATCNCLDDYVQNNVSKVCDLYDPCNIHHRIWRKEPEDRCSMDNGYCLTLSHGKNSDYNCECKTGYKKNGDKDSTTCDPMFCEIKWMNKCDQVCTLNVTNKGHPYICSCYDGYIVNGDKCTFNTSNKFKCEKKCDLPGQYCQSNGQCGCQKGFDKETDNSCKIIIDQSTCPTGNSTKDNLCDCGPYYEFNKANFTCDLKPICGEGGRGRSECKKGQICQLDSTEEKMFKCVCPGDLKLQGNKCVNKCDFGKNSDECEIRNAICKPYKSGDFCECAPGFEMIEKTCVITKYSSRFDLVFKNEFKFQNCENLYIQNNTKINVKNVKYDLNGYVKDSMQADKLNQNIYNNITSQERVECFRGEILKVIGNLIYPNSYKDGLMNNSCNEEKNGDFKCVFLVKLGSNRNNDTDFFENLKSSCYPYGDKKQCFILLNNHYYYESAVPESALSQGKLIVDYKSVEDVILTPNKGCGEKSDNQNFCPSYSNCVQDKDNGYFNCTCNKEYFDVTSVKPLMTDIGEDKHYFIESCKEKQMCPHSCLEPGNSCIQKPTQPKAQHGDWIIEYACNCRGDKFPRNNATQCTSACQGITCKNGKLKAGDHGTCQCVCDEKYYGDACDSETSSSKGGWIAGIVVLAVLVVILAGVAFMFARRSRNNSTEYSGRPMDEYAGSSYRVPTNQSRGQQNPSFTRD